ncbi:MAG: ParA family protein [Blautia sp.]|nr:ParA family protein [Blautia sp.]
MAAKVIAFVNMKGGVAKTTTTVGVATILTSLYHKKVMVIDLDPQANASFMLMGEERWMNCDLENRTLYRLFEESLRGRTCDIDEILQKNVSGLTDVKNLDLLPSDTRLFEMDYNIIMESKTSSLLGFSMVDFIRHNIEHLLDDYDYVLIDCPPNLGIITLNGLKITDGFVIPTIPDTLSTFGIINVVKRIQDFSASSGHPIEPYGILYTKVRTQYATHKRIMEELPYREAYQGLPIFQTNFGESTTVTSSSEYVEGISTKKKWGYTSPHYQCLVSFTDELREKLGDLS